MRRPEVQPGWIGAVLALVLGAAVAPAAAAPSVDLQKTVYVGHSAGAGCPGGEEAIGTSGGPITYCFAIKNTGTTYLSSIQLTDGGIGITRADTTLLSGAEPLAPGATLLLYYPDIVRFDLVKTASTTATPTDAAGTPLGLSAVTDNDTAFVNRVAPAVVLEKTVYSGHSAGLACPGDELVTGPIGAAITYCFLVRNVGDTHLGSITIDDPQLGVTQAQMTKLLGSEPLPPSGSNTRILYYYQTTITADLTNTATVGANPVAFGGGDLIGVADVTAVDTASIDEFTIPTTTISTTTSTSTTSTTIQVCTCTDAIPFMANGKASLGTGTAASGSVGVNSAVGLLKLAPHTFMANDTTVYAARLKLADFASVYNLRTNFLSSGPTTQIRGVADALDVLPLTESFCPFSSPPTCGAGELQITTGPDEPVDLPAGDYGNVRIGAGSRLHLTDLGTYRFCSLTLWTDAELLADQQVTIDVAGGVSVGTRAKIRTASGAPLVLNVGGAKFRIGTSGQVDAAITAPAARLKVKQYGQVNGCLCAGLLKTAANANLVCVGD
jgi:hypothetical protein